MQKFLNAENPKKDKNNNFVENDEINHNDIDDIIPETAALELERPEVASFAVEEPDHSDPITGVVGFEQGNVDSTQKISEKDKQPIVLSDDVDYDKKIDTAKNDLKLRKTLSYDNWLAKYSFFKNKN